MEITDDDLDAIITEISKIWPACKMVRGRPRHSQSQGSVERLNRVSQTKLGHWMHDNNSRRLTLTLTLTLTVTLTLPLCPLTEVPREPFEVCPFPKERGAEAPNRCPFEALLRALCP